MRKLVKGLLKKCRFYRTDFSGRTFNKFKKSLSLLRFLKVRFFYKRRFRYKIMEVGGILRRRSRRTLYKVWSFAKQRFRNFYWMVLDHQFKKYIVRAKKKRRFFLQTFLNLLETRVDVVVFRMSYGFSMYQIRQFILHGFVLVNGFSVTRVSQHIHYGDLVSFNSYVPLFRSLLQSFFKRNTFSLGKTLSNVQNFFGRSFRFKQRYGMVLLLLKKGHLWLSSSARLGKLKYFKVVVLGKPDILVFLNLNFIGLFMNSFRLHLLVNLGVLQFFRSQRCFDFFFESCLDKIEFIRCWQNFFKFGVPELLFECSSFLIEKFSCLFKYKVSNLRRDSVVRFRTKLLSSSRNLNIASFNNKKNLQKFQNKSLFYNEFFLRKAQFVISGNILESIFSGIRVSSLLTEFFKSRLLNNVLFLSRLFFFKLSFQFKNFNIKKLHKSMVALQRIFFGSKLSYFRFYRFKYLCSDLNQKINYKYKYKFRYSDESMGIFRNMFMFEDAWKDRMLLMSGKLLRAKVDSGDSVVGQYAPLVLSDYTYKYRMIPNYQAKNKNFLGYRFYPKKLSEMFSRKRDVAFDWRLFMYQFLKRSKINFLSQNKVSLVTKFKVKLLKRFKFVIRRFKRYQNLTGNSHIFKKFYKIFLYSFFPKFNKLSKKVLKFKWSLRGFLFSFYYNLSCKSFFFRKKYFEDSQRIFYERFNYFKVPFRFYMKKQDLGLNTFNDNNEIFLNSNQAFLYYRRGFGKFRRRRYFRVNRPYPGSYLEISFKLLSSLFYKTPTVNQLSYPFNSRIFRLIDLYYT